MTTTSKFKTTPGKSHFLILFVNSACITLLLFFIDEGYYNFSWMSKIGNWVPFSIYVLAIFSGQLLFSKLLLKRYSGAGLTILSILGGTAIGIMVVIFGIFTNW